MNKNINTNNYEYVDLDLPPHISWSVMNVDANNPSDAGKMTIAELKKIKKMVDWGRLMKAILCTMVPICGVIFIINLPIYVLLALTIPTFVCLLIFLFYKALGD